MLPPAPGARFWHVGHVARALTFFPQASTFFFFSRTTQGIAWESSLSLFVSWLACSAWEFRDKSFFL